MAGSSRLIRSIVVGAVLASSGCGSSPEPGTASSASQFCAAFHSRMTRKSEGCARASAEALAAEDARSTFGCASYDLAVAAGHATFDDSKVSSCLAAVDALECGGPAAYGLGEWSIGSFWPGPVPECQAVVSGRIALGGSCNSLLDCAEGYCDMTTACPGTCVPYGEVGESCRNPFLFSSGYAGPVLMNTCFPGLGCALADAATDSWVCRSTSAVDGPCPCQAGLYCDPASSTCKEPKTSGACAGVAECALGYACTNTECRPAGVLGDACEPATQPFTMGGCAPGYACDPASRTCIRALADGQSCLVQLDGTSYFLACLHQMQISLPANDCTCVPKPKADGESCTSDGECLGTCDPVQQTCSSITGACY
jgi:hypothetical protein